jgi:uncharacterized protein YrrD
VQAGAILVAGCLGVTPQQVLDGRRQNDVHPEQQRGPIRAVTTHKFASHRRSHPYMHASALKNRAVLTLSDAEKVGQIDDVLFDPEFRRVLGFRVKKGMFGHSEALPRDRVQAVGTDALTVGGPDAINNLDRFPELSAARGLQDVHGTRVVTEGGSLLGTVDELEIDESAQQVLTYTLKGSLIDRLRGEQATIAPAEVLRLGEGGIMIVADAVAQRLGEQEKP